jgi:hypothetical protein
LDFHELKKIRLGCKNFYDLSFGLCIWKKKIEKFTNFFTSPEVEVNEELKKNLRINVEKYTTMKEFNKKLFPLIGLEKKNVSLWEYFRHGFSYYLTDVCKINKNFQFQFEINMREENFNFISLDQIILSSPLQILNERQYFSESLYNKVVPLKEVRSSGKSVTKFLKKLNLEELFEEIIYFRRSISVY